MADMLVHVQPDQTSLPGDGLVNTISQVGHLLEQRMDQALSSTGLTARQYQALLHIADKPGLGRGALGRLLRVSPQAAGTLTRRLRDARLIDYTEADPGRPVSFSVTDSGRGRLLAAVPIVAVTDRHLLAELPTVTVEFLGDVMRALALQIE